MGVPAAAAMSIPLCRWRRPVKGDTRVPNVEVNQPFEGQTDGIEARRVTGNSFEAFLRRSAAIHVYPLADLDDFFFPDTTWYTWTESDRIEVLADRIPGAASKPAPG